MTIRRIGTDMKYWLSLLMLLGACEWRNPTDPATAPAQSSDQVRDSLFTFESPVVTIKPGETASVVIRAKWPYPLGVDFRSDNERVARVTGKIPQGGSEGVAQITGIAAGEAEIYCVVYNFGRAPGNHYADGRIVVASGAGGRRRIAAR